MATVVFDGRAIRAEAGVFTVGFASYSDTEAISLGSGTLVRLGSTTGILTCGHVIKAIQNPVGKLGILSVSARDKVLQRPAPKISAEDVWSLWNGSDSPDGPDLGFLRLGSEMADSLAAKGSVLNLDQQAELYQAAKAAGRPVVPGKRVDRLLGVVAENTSRTESMVEFEVHLSAGILRTLIGGAVQREVFRPVPAIGEALPTNWGGTSGGGMWRFLYKDTPTGLEPVGRRFRGIAYFQTRTPTPAKRRSIVCHGPAAIYETLVPAVRDRWR